MYTNVFFSCNIQSISLKTSSKFNFVSKLGERLNKIEKKKLVVYGRNKRCFLCYSIRHSPWKSGINVDRDTCGKKRTRKSKYSRLLNWMLPKHFAKLPIGNFCAILDNFRYCQIKTKKVTLKSVCWFSKWPVNIFKTRTKLLMAIQSKPPLIFTFDYIFFSFSQFVYWF